MKLTGHSFSCNTLTNFEYHMRAMTGNGNYVNLFIFFRPGHDEPVVSISQALSNESQAQQIPHQQQPLQPMVFTTTASVVDPIPGDNPQLFHSTKF